MYAKPATFRRIKELVPGLESGMILDNAIQLIIEEIESLRAEIDRLRINKISDQTDSDSGDQH